MRCEILHDASAFEGLEAAWDALAQQADAGLFLSHRWLKAWWRAYRGVDELWLLVLRDGEQLKAALPLHLRAPRSGPIRVAELRIVGDLGIAQRSFLCRPDELEPAAGAFFDALGGERGWDVIDLPVDALRAAEGVERVLAARGVKADRTEVAGRAYADLPPATDWDEWVRSRRPARTLHGAIYEDAPAAAVTSRALDELLRLLRKEWAAREASSPAADPQAVQFLHDAVPDLVARGLARVGLLRLPSHGIVAADLVVRDRDRHVQLLRGTDPEHLPAGAAEQLTLGSVKAAVESGARRFELADDETPLKSALGRVVRVRAWNTTTFARLHRSVTSLTNVVRSGGEARRALDRLRDRAPDVVTRAFTRVATYATLHLYRGELFTRDVREAPDLQIRLFTRADFDALGEAERERFITRLDLQPSYCRQKWDRGDTVVYATVDGQPAGIVWCARAAVYVPDIGREVRPGSGECYIHDVYVHPDQRGRQVAPAMLDFLARELRARDVYRAWALIERSNTASTRAFEKAAYASVSDVVYARMGLASRLIVRPPDPEARAFLGLP